MYRQLNRRTFLKVMGLGSAALALPGFACRTNRIAGGKRPNIIYIMADDLGYGDLGCYGQQRIRTPNLDRLAAEGIRLTDHYAGITVCAPSRCSLMTGRHTGHTVVRGNREVKPMGQYPLPTDTPTVSRLLQQAGYATALIGKWGLGGPGSTGIPNRQGFDYFYGYLCQRHAHNYYPEFLFENEERVPLPGNRVAEPRPDGAGFAVERARYSHDLLAREALAFVERNRDKPFFLYLALTIPHANNEGGRKGMEVPSSEPYANEEWPEPQKGHAAMITRMDRDIGRLLAKVKELGLDEDTLVIFTSDNGPHREGGNDPEFNDSKWSVEGHQARPVRRRHPRATDRPLARQDKAGEPQRSPLGFLGFSADRMRDHGGQASRRDRWPILPARTARRGTERTRVSILGVQVHTGGAPG